jgi:outer membrane lipoprotein carrier protein
MSRILAAFLFLAVVGAPQSIASLLGNKTQWVGQFTQVIEDAQGKIVGESRGSFAVLKPSFIRWQIDEPGQQIMLANGSVLWQYDIDLETATRRPLPPEAQSPLLLLTADTQSLDEQFWVSEQPKGLRIVPKSPGAFQALHITYQNELPTMLVIEDNAQQTVKIRLEHDTEASILTPEDFEFFPPEGIDIMLESGE